MLAVLANHGPSGSADVRLRLRLVVGSRYDGERLPLSFGFKVFAVLEGINRVPLCTKHDAALAGSGRFRHLAVVLNGKFRIQQTVHIHLMQRRQRVLGTGQRRAVHQLARAVVHPDFGIGVERIEEALQREQLIPRRLGHGHADGVIHTVAVEVSLSEGLRRSNQLVHGGGNG